LLLLYCKRCVSQKFTLGFGVRSTAQSLVSCLRDVLGQRGAGGLRLLLAWLPCLPILRVETAAGAFMLAVSGF